MRRPSSPLAPVRGPVVALGAVACALVLALSVGPLVAPATADEVHLTNGHVFEEVEARVEGDRVVIRIDGGEIALPASRVARVVEAETTLGHWLERRRALGDDAPAQAFVDLARWARERGFARGVRDAALAAAEREPRHPALADLLGPLGYVQAEDTGAWITHDEAMARRGFVRDGSEWVPREVAEERARARRLAIEETSRRLEERRRERRAARLEAAVTALALDALERASEPRQTLVVHPHHGAHGAHGVPVTHGTVVGTAVAAPVVFSAPTHSFGLPFFGAPPTGTTTGGSTSGSGEGRRTGFSYNDLAVRQPGSIIPMALDPGTGNR